MICKKNKKEHLIEIIVQDDLRVWYNSIMVGW
jgi:hypothetical protein